MWHPLHKEHPLTLLTLFQETASSSDNNPPVTNLCCNKCQQPCQDGYTYHCPTCQFTLHLKCFFLLDHEKHRHPLFLVLGDPGWMFGLRTGDCSICGFTVNGINFSCSSCKFYIHYECSLIPTTIKDYHVHELTIRHNFPEKCDQVYCDKCEDKNGELDRKSSHYYCERCDYIAHVSCVLQLTEDRRIFKRFTHEHPLKLTKKNLLCCYQCDYSVNRESEEYPLLIKHPRHPDHTLSYVQSDNLYKCTDCEFTFEDIDTHNFVHPYGELPFRFKTNTQLFVCDICGEYGKGSKLSTAPNIDIHLECFALPGKLEHESHPRHTLYLSSSIPKEDSSHAPSARWPCNICNKEIDKMLWIYCCLDCSYVAHVTCVANDMLSTFRSSIKNRPDFCAIIEPDKKSFELHIAQIRPSPYSWPLKPLLMNLVKSKIYNDDEKKTFKVEEGDGKISCPRCSLQLSIRAKDSGLEIGNQVSVTAMNEI